MTRNQSGNAPIVLHEDRYGGVYSGGRWLAVGRADQLIESEPRSQWVVRQGPGDGDIPCAVFWSNPPTWIAVGETPEMALAALLNRDVSKSGIWTVDNYRESLATCLLECS